MKEEKSGDEHAEKNIESFREEHHEHLLELGLQDHLCTSQNIHSSASQVGAQENSVSLLTNTVRPLRVLQTESDTVTGTSPGLQT